MILKYDKILVAGDNFMILDIEGHSIGGVEILETTTEQVIPERKPDLCTTKLECADYADCSFDTMEYRYKCMCQKYYVGDGTFKCIPGPGILKFL